MIDLGEFLAAALFFFFLMIRAVRGKNLISPLIKLCKWTLAKESPYTEKKTGGEREKIFFSLVMFLKKEFFRVCVRACVFAFPRWFFSFSSSSEIPPLSLVCSFLLVRSRIMSLKFHISCHWKHFAFEMRDCDAVERYEKERERLRIRPCSIPTTTKERIVPFGMQRKN